MRQDPESSTSETYKIKFPTFENGKPEELLQTMKELKTATEGTGNTSATIKTHCLYTMLHGEALI